VHRPGEEASVEARAVEGYVGRGNVQVPYRASDVVGNGPGEEEAVHVVTDPLDDPERLLFVLVGGRNQLKGRNVWQFHGGGLDDPGDEVLWAYNP
jgi:hypothetical protein